MRSALIPVLFGGYQPETKAWLQRVSSAGGQVSGGTIKAVDQFVKSAKANGFWSLFRRLNLCCGDFNASFVPLVNTSGGTTDTNVNLVSGDYSESLGWRSDGSTKYINTGYSPSEATGGLSIYLRVGITPGAVTTIGAVSGAQYFRVLRRFDNSLYCSWGGPDLSDAVATNANTTLGLVHGVRVSSTDMRAYLNGSQPAATYTTNVTPGASAVMTLLAQGPPPPSQFMDSAARMSAYGVDSGMNSTQAAAYYTAMQAFQTSLGRQV